MDKAELEKAAKGFLGNFQKLRDNAEKLHKAAGALTDAAADHMAHLDKMHGDMTGAAESDDAEKAAAAAALVKAAADKAAAAEPLEKRFAALEAKLAEESAARVLAEKQVEQLAAGVEDFVKAGAAVATRRPALREVSKAADGQAAGAAADEPKDAVSLIKRAQAQPITLAS